MVNTKASQSGLDALTVHLNTVATRLKSNYNTLRTLLGTRASQTSVTAALATKQDLLGNSVTLGSLNLIGNSDVALLQHSEGFVMQTNDGTVTYGVFTSAGATLRKLIVQNEIVIPDDAISLFIE